MAEPKKNEWFSKIEKLTKKEGAIRSGVASVLPSLVERGDLFLESPSFNWALGGGIKRPRMVMFYGPESSGKTLLAYMTVKAIQQDAIGRGVDFSNPKFPWVKWYDAELVGFSESYAKKLGINTDFIWVTKNNSSRNIFDHFVDTVGPMIQEGFPCEAVVIDSVKSIIGPKEANLKHVDEHIMGDISALLPKALKRMLPLVVDNGMLGVFVQQVNEEMDQIKQKQNIKYRIPSGKALVHHMDYIVLVERVERKDAKMYSDGHSLITDMPLQVGHTIRCKVQKNRVGAPYRVAEFMFDYNNGIVRVPLEIVKLGIGLGVIERPTNVTYKFGATEVKGFDNFVKTVGDSRDLQVEIMKAAYNFNPNYQNFTENSPDAVILTDTDIEE